MAAYLNALPGGGVHIVTVNDYLAQRDADWMKPLYEFLGLSVGVIVSAQDSRAKQQAYEADITYGTNNEFGFDYLRDNMAFSKDMRYQRGLNFAIVDEVDSILIDEARTPLIISGPSDDSSETYRRINKLIPKLKRQEYVESLQDRGEDTGHYTVDEKQRNIELTELGHEFVEQLLVEEGLLEAGESLYAPVNLSLFHHLHAALKAHILFQRDVEYIVQNNEIIIVDEHTGRTMPGRRWSEGIHQAVEAKEGVNIKNESQTLASTTFQNYFRLYKKLSGMTGTADTEAYEFRQIYGLDVVVIPTHKPMIRIDHNDLIYMSTEEKYEAIVEDIEHSIEKGSPVLVGTASIETSEHLSAVLNKKKIQHQVLNAKQHEKEAQPFGRGCDQGLHPAPLPDGERSSRDRRTRYKPDDRVCGRGGLCGGGQPDPAGPSRFLGPQPPARFEKFSDGCNRLPGLRDEPGIGVPHVNHLVPDVQPDRNAHPPGPLCKVNGLPCNSVRPIPNR